MARLGREHLGNMSNEGDSVRARRERLGMDKKALAEESGVNRNTLHAIESGESFNRSTLAKVERALDRLEEEMGINAPPPPNPEQGERLVEIEVGEGAGRVIVRGPVSDADALAQMAERLMRQQRKETGDQ